MNTNTIYYGSNKYWTNGFGEEFLPINQTNLAYLVPNMTYGYPELIGDIYNWKRTNRTVTAMWILNNKTILQANDTFSIRNLSLSETEDIIEIY